MSHPRSATLVALLLSSCGTGAGREEAATTTTAAVIAPTTAPDPSALQLGQQARTAEGNTVQIVSFQQPLPPRLLEPEPGMEFAAVEAEICAGPRGARRVTAEAFQVELADGTRRGRSFFGPKEPAFADTRLTGNACMRGWVNFELPKGERPANVVFRGSSPARWSLGGGGRR